MEDERKGLNGMGLIAKLDLARQLLDEQGRTKEEAYEILHTLLDTVLAKLASQENKK